MRHRLAATIAALTITGALAGGGAALASAAGTSTTTTPSTSTTQSTTPTTPSTPTAPAQAPGGARPNGTHHCPNMGSSSSSSTAY